MKEAVYSYREALELLRQGMAIRPYLYGTPYGNCIVLENGYPMWLPSKVYVCNTDFTMSDVQYKLYDLDLLKERS